LLGGVFHGGGVLCLCHHPPPPPPPPPPPFRLLTLQVYFPDGLAMSPQEMIEYSKKKREIRHANTRLPAHMLAAVSTGRASLLSTMGDAAGAGPAQPAATSGDDPHVNG
jgi:hypothetical protein